MGIITGSSASFTRFRIADVVPQELWSDIPIRLKRYAMLDIDAIPEERGFGWTNIDDMLDTGFSKSGPEKGAYLAFALRLDTRRIPPAVMKKQLALALREEDAKNREVGKSFIARERRTELKEQVRLRLMQRFLPIPAVFDVIWNIRSGIIWLGSVSPKVIDLFSTYFTETFDLHLEALTPYALASTLVPESDSILIDTIEPTDFV